MDAMQPEPLTLRRALEWELSLDSRDLRSHAWYHGPIPRPRAEEIVQREGDFLIRDCVSQPGNFVLTCKSKGPVMHFVINKILIQPETVYERVQYQFEDDAYDTVPDLITFYVGSGKVISVASGARIQSPCNRTHPLALYSNRFGGSTQAIPLNCGLGGGAQIVASPLSSPSMVGAGFRQYSNNQPGNYNSYRSPMSSPPRMKRDVPPKLPSKKQQRSQSLTPAQAIAHAAQTHYGQDHKYQSADGVCHGNGTKDKLIEMKPYNSADGVIQLQGADDKEVAMSRSADDHCSVSGSGLANKSNTIGPRNGAAALMNDLKFCTNSLSRIGMHGNGGAGGGGGRFLHRSPRPFTLNRESSNEVAGGSGLSPCVERRLLDREDGFADDVSSEPSSSSYSPPPKPIRAATTVLQRSGSISGSSADGPAVDNVHLGRVVSYHTSGSDSGNGSGDSAHSSAAGDPLDGSGGGVGTGGAGSGHHRGGVIIRNPCFLPTSASVATLKSVSVEDEHIDYMAVEQSLLEMNVGVPEVASKFDLDNFSTLLLPSVENKPLEIDALNTFRMMLCESGPRVLANHLTRIDIRMILGEAAPPGLPISPIECTGIELIALDHGYQLRQDLLERTECIKLLVAVTVLTCNCNEERADTLCKWIQVAVDTKTALGNLFGFCAIMLGLCMPQIQKLETAWHILRQRYTDSAFNFEAKLRPTLKCMNDCSNPQAPNTTVPHLLPYILLRDRRIEDYLTPINSTLFSSCIATWESSSVDFGFSILFNHLDAMRSFTRNLSLYQRNAQTVLKDSSSRLDELLEDAFRTEFHMKFLWGSKGALATAYDRHTKMEQLLTVMADRHFSNESAEHQQTTAV